MKLTEYRSKSNYVKNESIIKNKNRTLHIAINQLNLLQDYASSEFNFKLNTSTKSEECIASPTHFCPQFMLCH